MMIMNIDKQINCIVEKLSKLKKKDRKFNIFGASQHKYTINEKLSEEQLEAFEKKHSIALPIEYRTFLRDVGNGGAGPYYGLQTLEDSLFIDLDYKRPGEFVNPSIPFPFNEAWNMEFEGNEEDDIAYEKFSEEYYSDKWETGVLRICNYGCGISLNLVVNGQEKGNIWVDDRGNDGGIYPDSFYGQTGRTSFLDWYTLWLNLSLKK